MGKKGKAKKWRNIAITVSVLLVFALIVGGYMWSVGNDGEEVKDGEEGDVTPTGGSASLDCNTAPTLTSSVRNALEQGTAVTTGTHYKVNGVYVGTSAPSSYTPGDKVQLILNASSYIDVLTDEITMGCGNNKITKDGSEAILMYDYTAATITVKEDSTTLTDSATGGASNASAIANGGSDTYTVCLTGTDKDSTGDTMLVWELGTTANVSTVNMYDGSGKSLSTEGMPSFYTDTITSPYKKAFKVPAIENAVEKCYSATVAAKSGKHVGGAVYLTAYVGEPFVEDDGSFVEWGVEQEDGDTKYEATYDYDFFIDRS